MRDETGCEAAKRIVVRADAVLGGCLQHAIARHKLCKGRDNGDEGSHATGKKMSKKAAQKCPWLILSACAELSGRAKVGACLITRNHLLESGVAATISPKTVVSIDPAILCCDDTLAHFTLDTRFNTA
jgi:hypothetical protein